MNIYAVVDGTVKNIESVQDEVFSRKMLGDGVAIEPASNKITSPCDGEITIIYPSKHLIGIKTAGGSDLLIHMGIDTAELNGKPFKVKAKVGDHVKAGSLLCKADFGFIRRKGYIADVMIISSSSEIKCLKDVGRVDRSDIVFETIDGGKA